MRSDLDADWGYSPEARSLRGALPLSNSPAKSLRPEAFGNPFVRRSDEWKLSLNNWSIIILFENRRYASGAVART
jgi:hypothetical protein